MKLLVFHIAQDECVFMHTQFQCQQASLSSRLIIFRVYFKGQD